MYKLSSRGWAQNLGRRRKQGALPRLLSRKEEPGVRPGLDLSVDLAVPVISLIARSEELQAGRARQSTDVPDLSVA